MPNSLKYRGPVTGKPHDIRLFAKNQYHQYFKVVYQCDRGGGQGQKNNAELI